MLPETLKELREERGMKQAQIAIILGVKQNTYSNWENGTRNPSLEMLVKIADYYKTSTDYLLVGYVPPFAEIRRFFKIKIRRPSLRLFL
jgi:transcriptional regulator with XRE-family HTH domain